MSFLLAYNKNEPEGRMRKNILIKGDVSLKNESAILLMKGEIYNCEEKDIINIIKKDGINNISKLLGEFCLVYDDIESQKIYIINDRSGREVVFYYWDNLRFIVSDDFWEIINVIEPTQNDINIQNLKESLVFYYPLFWGTIINNLYFLPPASIGEFSLKENSLKIKKYWDFKYNIDWSLTLDDAVEMLDDSLNKAFLFIKSKNSPQTIYGVGISGGLDSRIIPYYALKYGMKLKSFIIGESRPDKFLLSRDHKNARKIAKYYGLDHYEVEYNSEPFNKKIFWDIRYFPMGVSQIFVTLRDTVPNFDVLLTGASGLLVGSALPSQIEVMSRDELFTQIINQFSQIDIYYSFTTKLRKLLNYFGVHGFKNPPERKEIEPIEGIIKPEEFEQALQKIRKFVDCRKDKSNLDIFEEYFYLFLGSRNKYGAFESLQGRQKSYSIYSPFLLDTVLKWKTEFLIGRKVLKHLILKKIPSLSNIMPQNIQVAISQESSQLLPIYKVISLVDLLIRGGGVGPFERWARRKDYLSFSTSILFRKNRLFEEYFDTKYIVEQMSKRKINFRLYDQLIKIKMVMDILEEGIYEDFK